MLSTVHNIINGEHAIAYLPHEDGMNHPLHPDKRTISVSTMGEMVDEMGCVLEMYNCETMNNWAFGNTNAIREKMENNY